MDTLEYVMKEMKPMKHLVAGVKVQANSEYLQRHNRALMVTAVTWVKEYKLVGSDVVQYKEWWEQGTVMENERLKLVQDFEFHLCKTLMERRPDVSFENKTKK